MSSIVGGGGGGQDKKIKNQKKTPNRSQKVNSRRIKEKSIAESAGYLIRQGHRLAPDESGGLQRVAGAGFEECRADAALTGQL